MVKCKECATEVSSKAEKCPKCGAPVKKRTGCLAATAAVAFVFIVVAWVAGTVAPPDETSAPASTGPQSTDKATRAQVFVGVIKKSLRNPASFDPIQVLVTDAGAVCVEYGAENGFGGMAIEKAVMNAAQSKAANSSESGFQAIWNAECAGKTGLDTTAIFKR
jgi:hypothetical protein